MRMPTTPENYQLVSAALVTEGQGVVLAKGEFDWACWWYNPKEGYLYTGFYSDRSNVIEDYRSRVAGQICQMEVATADFEREEA